jgi:signal transduction histidine kinase
MKNPGSSLDELLVLLDSADARQVERAVEEMGKLLRDGSLDKAKGDGVEGALRRASGHAKWSVRRAVARAAECLRLEALEAVVSPLLLDDHSLVKSAAHHAMSRRVALGRPDILKEEHEELLAGWLADLEKSHGKAARENAHRVATRYAEHRVREIHHELVKVLTPLNLSLQSLEREVDREKISRTRCRSVLRRSASRLGLVVTILDSVLILAKEVVPELQETDLGDLLADAVAMIKGGRHGRKLRVDIQVPSGLVVEGHRERLSQVFLNVLQNAVDAYHGLDRLVRVKIRAHLEGSQAVVTVADKGCGMSPEVLRTAFLAFKPKKPGGFGLGLPLSRRIVEMEHRGTIELASREGMGTTVTVKLPLEQDAR